MSDLLVQQQEKMLNNPINSNSFTSTPEYTQLVSEVENLRKLYQNLEKQISQGTNTGNIDLNENSSQFEHLTRSYKCLKYEVKNLKSADVLNRLSSLETNVSQQAMLWNDFSNYFQDFVTKLGKDDSNSNKICSQMKKPLIDINKNSENQHNIINDSDHETQSKKSQSNENKDNSILTELKYLKKQVQLLENKDIPDRLSAVEDKLSTHNSLWDKFTSNIAKLYSSQKSSGSERYNKELKGAHEEFSQLIQSIIQEENENLNTNSNLEERLEVLERNNKIQTSLWNQFSSNISEIILLDSSSSTANNTKKQEKLREAGSQFKQLISEITHGNEPISESNRSISSLKDEMKRIIQRVSSLENSNADVSSLEEKVNQHTILWAQFQENIHHLLNNHNNGSNNLNPEFAEDIRSLIQKDNGKVTTRNIQLEPSESNDGNDSDRLSRLENNVRVQQELWNLFMKNISAATNNTENPNSDQFLKNRDAFISMVGELVRKNSNNNNSNSNEDQSYRISQLESQVRAHSHLWEQFVNNLQNSIGLNSSDKKAQSALTKQYNEYHSQLERLVNISNNSNNNANVISRSVDIGENQKALDEIREQIKKLEENHEQDLKRIQNQIKQESDSLKNGLKSSIQDIEHKQSETEKTTNEMIQTIQEQQQKQLKDLQKDLSAAKKDIKTSQQTQKTQKGDLDNVKSELQKYQEELQKLQTSQKQQQTNMDKHQQDYQKLQKDLQKIQKTQQTQDKSAKNYQTDLQKLQTAQQEQDNKLKNYQEEQRQLHEEEHKQQEETHQKLDEALQKLETNQQTQDKSIKTIQNDLQKIQKSQQTQDKSTKNYKTDLQKLQTAQQEQEKAIKDYQEEQRQLHEDERKQQEETHQKLDEALQKLETTQQTQNKSIKNLQSDIQKIQKAQQTQDKSTKNYKTDLQKLQTAQQEQEKAIKDYQEEQRKLHEDERKQQDESHQKLEEALQKLETAQQAHEKSAKTLQSDLQKVQKAQQTQDKSVKNYKSDIQKLQTAQQEQDKAIKNYQEELQKLQSAQQEQDNKLKNYLDEQSQLHEDDHKQQEEAQQKLDETLQKLQAAQEAQEQLVKNLQSDLQKLQKAQQTQDKSAKTSKSELQKLQTAQQEQDKAIKDYQEEQRKLREDERKQQEEARLKIQEDIQKLKAAQDKSAKDYQTELQKLQRTQQTQDKSVKNSQAELQKLQKAQQVPDGLFKTYQEEQRKLHEEEHKQQEEAHQKIEEELKKLQTAQQTIDKSLKTYQNELQKVQKTQKKQDESLQNYQEEQRKLHEDEHKQQEETHQKHDEALQKLETNQQTQDKSIKTIQNDLQKVQKAQQTQDKSTKNYKADIQKLQTAQQEQDKSVKKYQSDIQKLQSAQQEQDTKLKNYQEEQRQLHEEEHKQQEETHQKLDEALQKLETNQQTQDKSIKTIQNDLQKIQKSQQTQDKSTKNYKTDLQKLQTAQQEQEKAIKDYQEEQRQLHEDERKQQEETHQKLDEALQKLETTQQTQNKSIKNLQSDIQKVQKAQQTQDRSVKNSQAELQKIQQAQQNQQVPDGLFKTYQEEQRKLHEEEHKQQEEAHQKIEEELKKLQTAQQTIDKSLKTYQNELQKVQKTQKKQDETAKNSQTELKKLQEAQKEQDKAIKDYQEEQRQLHEDESKQHEEEHQKIDEAILKLENAQQEQEETFKNHQNEFQKIQKSASENQQSSSPEDIQRIDEELQKHANILQDHDDIFTKYQEEHRQSHELDKKQQEEEHKKIEEELNKLLNNQQKVENDVNVQNKLWDQFTRNLHGLLHIDPNENEQLNTACDEYNEQLKELATRNVDIQDLEDEENLHSLAKLRKDVDVHSSLWNQFVQNLLKLNIVDPEAANEQENPDFLKQSQKEFANQIRSLTSNGPTSNVATSNGATSNVASSNVASSNVASSNGANSNIASSNGANSNVASSNGATYNVDNADLGEIRNQISEVNEKVNQHTQLWINYERNLQNLLNRPQSNSNEEDKPSQFENDIKSLLATTKSVNLSPSSERSGNQSYDSRLDKLESDVQAQKSLWEQFSKNIQILTNCDSEDENSMKELKQNRDAFAHQISKIVSHDNTDNNANLKDHEQRIEELEKNAELQNSLWTRFMNNIQGITKANESDSPESKELLKNCQKDFVDQMKSLVDHKVASKDEPFFGSYERLAQEVSEIRRELNSIKSGSGNTVQERSLKLDDNESSLSENYAKNPARYDMTNIRSAYDLPYSESHANDDESSSSFVEAEYCQESSEYSSACPTSRSANNDNDENENNEENNEDNNNNQQQQQHHHRHRSKKSSSPEARKHNIDEPTTPTTREVHIKGDSHTTNIIHKVDNGPVQEQIDNIYKELKCIKYELKQIKFRTVEDSPKQPSIIQRLRENQNQLSSINPQSPEFSANNNGNNENNLFNIEEPEESTESESEGGDYTNDDLNKKIKLNKKSISKLQKKFDMIHSSMNKQVLLWDQFDNSLHQLLNATLAEMEMPTSADVDILHNAIRCIKYEIRKMKVEEQARSEKLFEKKSVQDKQLQEEISQLVEEVRKLQKVCAKFNNIEEDSINKTITDSIKCLKHEVRNLKKNSNFSSEQRSGSITEQSSIQKRRGILSDENKKSNNNSDNNSANRFASQASLDEWINEVKNLRNLYETIQYNSEIRPLSSAPETQSNTLLMSEEAASSSSFIDEKSEFSEISQHKKNTDSRISKISDIPPQGHEIFSTNQQNEQLIQQVAAIRSELEILKREFKKMQSESIATNPQNGKNTTTLLSTSSSSSQEHLEKLNNNDQSFESRIDNVEKAIAKIQHNMKNNTRYLPSSSTTASGKNDANDNTNQDETQSISSLVYDVRCMKYELKKIKDTLSKPSSLSPEAINSILTSKTSQPTKSSKTNEDEGSRIIQYIFSQLEELPKLRNEIETLKKQGRKGEIAAVNERDIIIDQSDDQKPTTMKQLVSDVERLKTQLASLNGRIDYISRGQPQKDDTLINGSISNISSLSLEDSFGDILLTSDQSQTRFDDINHEIESIRKELKNLTSQISTIQDIVATTIRVPEEGSDTSAPELTAAQQQLLQQKQQRIDDILDDLNNVKEEIKVIKANQLIFSDNSSVASINSTSSTQSGTNKNDTISILAKKYKKLQEQQLKLNDKVDQLASASPNKLIDPSNPTKVASNDDQNADILELKESMKDLQLDQKRIRKLVIKYVQGDKNQQSKGIINDTTTGETKDSDLAQNDDASQLDTLKRDLNQTKRVVSVLKREVTQLTSSSKNNSESIADLRAEYDRVRGELMGFASVAKASAAAQKKTTATPAASKK